MVLSNRILWLAGLRSRSTLWGRPVHYVLVIFRGSRYLRWGGDGEAVQPENAEAGKMLENATDSHASGRSLQPTKSAWSARCVSRLFAQGTLLPFSGPHRIWLSHRYSILDLFL